MHSKLTFAGTVDGARRLLPVSVFVIPFGIAFGVAAVESGLGAVQSIVMSAAVFTATAQFAALEILQEPIAYFSLAMIVFALSARHIVMGAALSTQVNELPAFQRLLVLSLLSDANFAQARSAYQQGERDLGILFGGGLMLWATWVGSTAFGAYGGNLLGDPDRLGFGVVMICFFAATCLAQLRQSSELLMPASIAMLVAIVTLSILPAGWNVIAGALAGGFVSLKRDADR